MSKTVVVFDHDTGVMETMPLGPGGFVTITEAPMTLIERTDNAQEGTVTLRLGLVVTPPSQEGKQFLEGQQE